MLKKKSKNHHKKNAKEPKTPSRAMLDPHLIFPHQIAQDQILAVAIFGPNTSG
jgi:hypothetical protein